MSMILMVKAMQAKVGNPLRKLVLIKMADNANDEGECWPSYQHIADQCEIGRSTVRKHIKELEKQGFLRITNRKGVLGNSSNLYVLTFDKPIAQNSTGVAPDSTGVAPDSIPPVAPDSTRTSHSFEPVNEPSATAAANGMDVGKAFEVFWDSGISKKNKKQALRSFTAYVKRNKVCPNEFAEKLAQDVKARKAAQQLGFNQMHPTTYLNNERWEDELDTSNLGSTNAHDNDDYAMGV